MQKYKPRSFSKRTARPTLTRPESLVEFEIYQPFLDRSSQDWIWNVFFYSNKLNQLRICLLKKSAAFLEMAAIVLQVIFKAKLGTFFMSSYWVKKQMLPRFSQVYKYFFHEPISLPEQLQILNWKPNFLNEQLFFFTFILLPTQCSGKEIGSWRKNTYFKKFKQNLSNLTFNPFFSYYSLACPSKMRMKCLLNKEKNWKNTAQKKRIANQYPLPKILVLFERKPTWTQLHKLVVVIQVSIEQILIFFICLYSLISIRQNYNFDMLAMIWH